MNDIVEQNSRIIDLSQSELPAAGGASNNSLLAQIEQSRAVQEVQGQILIAKRFPRDEIQAINKIKNECQRPSLAAVAMYTYAKGGTEISGPSIRLAEVLKRHWGNIQTGFRYETRGNESTVTTYAWDMETNVREEKTFVVKHIRNTRNGSYPIKDEREIYELIANQASRRVRACILAIIPGDIAEMGVEECERTLKTKAEVTPERVQKMLELFASYGVTRAAVEKRIQRTMDSIAPAQFISLGKIANSLADGMSKPKDWFEMEEAKPADGEKGNNLDQFKDKKKKAPEPAEPTGKEAPAADAKPDALTDLLDGDDAGTAAASDFPGDRK